MPIQLNDALGEKQLAIHVSRKLRVLLVMTDFHRWTAGAPWEDTGLTDIPLTADGEAQAHKLALRLDATHFQHVLTSPLRRARRTCKLVGLGENAEIEPDLAEWDNGDYEGMRSVDICKQHPSWNIFRDGAPNGESAADIFLRADRLITRLRTMTGNVVLFSHGQFGAVLASRWIGLSVVEAQHFQLEPASLSILSYAIQHPELSVIELWNSSPNESSQLAAVPDEAHNKTQKQPAIQQWENEGGAPENKSSEAHK